MIQTTIPVFNTVLTLKDCCLQINCGDRCGDRCLTSVNCTAIASAISAHDNKQLGWTWIFAGIAILFNPILPIYLERGTWQIIDVITALVFLFSSFTDKQRQEGLPPTNNREKDIDKSS